MYQNVISVTQPFVDYLLFIMFIRLRVSSPRNIGRGPKVVLMHPPPHILMNLCFSGPLGPAEHEMEW